MTIYSGYPYPIFDGDGQIEREANQRFCDYCDEVTDNPFYVAQDHKHACEFCYEKIEDGDL